MNVLRDCHTKLQPQKYCGVILTDTAPCQNMVLLQNGRIKYVIFVVQSYFFTERMLPNKVSFIVHASFLRYDSQFS